MSWTRFDDNWCEHAVVRKLTSDTFRHYFHMIQYCSRSDTFDGVLDLIDAERASRVPDARGAIAELVEAGLVENVDGENLRLVRIDDHVPPPYMRDQDRKAKQRERKQRQRAKQAENDPVPRDVTRDTGTGQDGPGQEVPPQGQNNDDNDRTDEWREAWGEDPEADSGGQLVHFPLSS